METNTNYTERASCRLCGGGFKSVINIGDIHVSTFIDTADQASPKVPIDLVVCEDCDIMQLRHTVNGDTMYREYWYQSGLNKFMVDALRDVAMKTLDKVLPYLTPNDVIVDIGANDGTLLDQYPEWVKASQFLIAYEPSNLFSLAIPHADLVINDYFKSETYHQDRKAKIVTSIAMFYDLENPHEFIGDVSNILDINGVWTIQLMDLLSMIAARDFPNLCHEHLEYYRLRDIVSILSEHNLRVFDVEWNQVNGSSLRVYVCHADAPYETTDMVTRATKFENDFFDNIGDVGTYFRTAVEDVRRGVVAFIKYQRSNNKRIAVMGASTKGNTILQYFNLGPEDIEHAAEINPDKYGKLTVGTNIPIIPEVESLASKPDYYLILPWGFLNNFIQRNVEYLQSGGAFITPLPVPMIIESKDGVLHSWEI